MKKSIQLAGLIFISVLLMRCTDSQNHANSLDVSVPQNNIRSYLSRVAAEITDNAIIDVSSISDWENKRSKRHEELVEMLGIQDYYNKDKTDLHVTVTGTIQRDGYRIEKLHYQSLPGLYVPAHLYIPDNIENPVPAILYVNGHARTQNVHYQPYPAKFAKLGFVCLIIETIQFGEVRGEHHGCYSRGWFNWYSRGYNPGGVEVWNALRGLDLLASKPEVDGERMGVTGISGGGSQSWYIGAIDNRIKAVAPVCGASTLKAQIGQRTIDGHCDCMMPINTRQIDFQNIGALIAPRPLLIAQADRDGLNTIESVRELSSDLKKIYELYGKGSSISFVETPGGHSYHQISREEIHSFFLKHLMGKDVPPKEAGDIDISENALLTADELSVYTDGVPSGDRTTTIQDSFIKLAKKPDINDESDLVLYRDKVKSSLLEQTFGHFPTVAVPFDSKMEFRADDGGKFGWNTYSFVSEKGWRLKIDFHWNSDTSKPKPLLIVLKNYDEERGASANFVSEINTDWNVAYFETRGVGENGWDPALQWHIRRAAAWTGRTIASMQVYDLLRCIRYCRSLSRVDSKQIAIAAKDEMTAVALYAALIDGNCSRIIVKNPIATQDVTSPGDGKGPAVEMLNCLRITDVNQLPALIYPIKTEMMGNVPDSYDWSKSILKKLSAR